MLPILRHWFFISFGWGGGDARKKTTLSNGVGAEPFSSAVDLKRAFVIGRAGGSFTSVAATDDEVSCIRERERDGRMSCACGGMESTKEIYSLAGIVVWVVEDEIGEDDLDALAAVTAEFVVAIHRGGVRRRVAGRSERAVLLQVAAEQTVARRTCNQKQRAPLLFS